MELGGNPDDRPPLTDRGELHRYSLRFLDDDLESGYQLDQGAKGIVGFKIVSLAAAILWVVAILVIPIAMNVNRNVAWMAGGSMAAASLLCYFYGRKATTLDRQHFAIAWLTVGNGVVIMTMAAASGDFEGYAVASILLLFAFGYVAGTRFVFAAMRTALIAVAFAVIVVTYESQRSLAFDVFVFVAGAIGSVLALRRSENERRRSYHQQLVISEQSAELQDEKEETDRLLLNILPSSISVRLKQGESPIADSFGSVSVLFADLAGFTPYAAALDAGDVTQLLSRLFVCFDDLVAERGLEKIKTIGDEYMAAGGLPDPLEDHAVRVVDLAMEMIRSTQPMLSGTGLRLRVGINSGPVSGGVIGSRKFAYDVWGTTVNMASRLQSTGIPGRVQVSLATRDLTASEFLYEPRGLVDLQGLGATEAFLVVSSR